MTHPYGPKHLVMLENRPLLRSSGPRRAVVLWVVADRSHRPPRRVWRPGTCFAGRGALTTWIAQPSCDVRPAPTRLTGEMTGEVCAKTTIVQNLDGRQRSRTWNGNDAM